VAELGEIGVRRKEAVIEEREGLPRQQRQEAQQDHPDRAWRLLAHRGPALPERKEICGRDEKDDVGPVQGEQCGQQGQGKDAAQYIAAQYIAAQSNTVLHQDDEEEYQQQVRQRVLQARGGVVGEGLGQREAEHCEEASRPRCTHPGDNQSDGGQRDGCGHQERREVCIARDQVEGREDQHPERVGVGLDPLRDVPGQAVAVHEIVDRAQRDVGIIAHPRGAHEHCREDREEDRCGPLGGRPGPGS